MADGSIRTRGWRARLAIVSLAALVAVPVSAATNQETSKQPLDHGAQVEVLEVDVAGIGAPSSSMLVPSGVFIDEVEPNETTATAQPLATLPVRLRGFLFRTPFVTGTFDNDFYSFTAPAGSRLYAATMTGWSGGSTDSVIEVLDVNGTTILESDDEDGGVSGSASNVGGTLLATGGTYFLRVRPFSTAPTLSSTIRPYDVYVSLQTGTPTAEVEPNNNGAPNPLPANGWVSGVIGTALDNDTFSFNANAGDTIVAILDVDPERDAPEWNARLAIGAFNNFLLLINGSGVGGTFDDANPSEALFMTTRTTGAHVIYIDEAAGGGAANFTYTLSVIVIPARVRANCSTYVGTAGAIGDLGTTDFAVAIPDAGLIDYMKLNLSATHTATADLDVTLISPDGNEVFLFDDPATTTTATAPQINFTLEDEGGIPAGIFGVHSGMRYATEAAGRFEYFKGMQRQGTWTLRVRDDLTANTGTVNSWSLEVCAPDPRPACLIPGPAETTVFATDFEANDGGFTHTGTLDEWERGLPSFAPITTAHSGVNAWKTDLDNTYDASSIQDLLSPGIDLTATSGRITLNWWQKFQMDSASNDSYWVEVRQVGVPASARRVFTWTGGLMTRSVGSPSVVVQQSAGWGLVQADISSFAGMNVEVRFHLDSSAFTQLAGVAIDDVLVTSCANVAGATPEALAVDTAGNGVFQPNETVVMAPTWRNTGTAALALLGALTNHTGPAGATYGIPDSSASYGTIAVNATSSCTSTGDCYSVSNATTARPVTHWDSTVLETVTAPSPTSKRWTLHIGDSFTDVPAANPFYRFVETILHRSVTGGCTTTTYCPLAGTSRESMAVFVLVSKGGAAPPACVAGAELFADVPATSPFCRWIEELSRRGVVAGCGGGNYCPQNPATREQMAVFVLRTLDPALNPPACVAGSEAFADVPASSPFCRWVEELARRGVVTGCGNGNYCPASNVTREQMSVFLTVTFGLVLYGL